MSGDQIDEWKRGIDRLKSEIVSRCEEIDRFGTCLPEDPERADRLIQEVKQLAKESYDIALKMVKLVKESLGDDRASVIEIIAKVTLQILMVTTKKFDKLSEKAPTSASSVSSTTDEISLGVTNLKLEDDKPADLKKLFEQYDELSSFYKIGDRIDQRKRAIDRLRLEKIDPKCSEIDQIANPADQIQWLTENPEKIEPTAKKIKKLTKELIELAKEAKSNTSKMAGLVFPDDPRAAMIKKMDYCVEQSVKVAEEGINLTKNLYKLKKDIDLTIPVTQQPDLYFKISGINSESNDLQSRRNEIFKQYDQLSKDYEKVTPRGAAN